MPGRPGNAHRSSLHELLDAYKPHPNFARTERIKSARLHPHLKPRHRVHIVKGRQEAVAEDAKWLKREGNRSIQMDQTSRGGRGGGRGAGEIRLAPRRKPCASWGASLRSVRTACVATSGRTSRPSQPHAGIRRARDRARQISRKLCRQDATPTSSDACIAASGESLCSFERATSPSQAT